MPRTDRFEKPFKPIRETSVTDYFGEIGDTSGVWRINLESESSALGIEAVEFLTDNGDESTIESVEF